MVMQLVGLRYTEPDLTISYPGFLYLLMKLDSMIRKAQSHCSVTLSSAHFMLFTFIKNSKIAYAVGKCVWFLKLKAIHLASNYISFDR